MPKLTWQGKEQVLQHHLDVPFHILHKQYSFQAPPSKPHNRQDNILIHGDNLLALKSLLPEFGGQVNCIYIDPPYNTGNENWVYNQCQRPADSKMAGRSGRQRRRRFLTSRQMAVHDVSASEIAQTTFGRRRRDFY
ncbi:TPA: hypothetical protein ACFNMX_000079 [Neisseria lactamica]